MPKLNIEQQPINIRRADWRRLPADCKSLIDGIPRVRARRGRRTEYIPVRFVTGLNFF